jgi:hypothetical protein
MYLIINFNEAEEVALRLFILNSICLMFSETQIPARM